MQLLVDGIYTHHRFISKVIVEVPPPPSLGKRSGVGYKLRIAIEGLLTHLDYPLHPVYAHSPMFAKYKR